MRYRPILPHAKPSGGNSGGKSFMETAPSTQLTSFNCPHCRALAQQFWWNLYAARMGKSEHPEPMTEARKDELVVKLSASKDFDDDQKRKFGERIANEAAGGVILESKEESKYSRGVDNLWLSICYACDRIAVWRHDRLLWPTRHGEPAPNADLPADVLADYHEAGSVLAASPRAAAALLRLAIQKLMPGLNQSGKDLNADIGNLVAEGLDIRIQQALDIVRVIGNHAVHPGQIDLRDDTATAIELFELVNLIAGAMISQPKQIGALYARIPASQIRQIEQRDRKK
jgi:hypothetical protein